MAEYEVIEANNERYELDDGEVFENKIIDFSNGNWFTIGATSTNFTIRNVGFVGTHDHDHNAIVARDPDPNGESVIENVYMGDGCIRPSSVSSHGQVGIFVHRSHKGRLEINNCNIQDWPNNGIYGNPPHYENGGSVHVNSCYAANNYVSNFRLGSSGSTITNCVAHNEGGRYDGRPLWAWGNDLYVSDCAFDAGGYSGGDAIHIRGGMNLTIEDTTHTGYVESSSGQGGSYDERGGVTVASTGSFDLTPPEVPTNAEEAASGERGSVGGGREKPDPVPEPEADNVYEVVASGDEAVTYYLEAKEGADLHPTEFNGATAGGKFWTSDDGTRAAGEVPAGKRHAWEMDSPNPPMMLDVTIEGGEYEAYVDRQESALGWYPQEGASGDDWKDLEALLDGESDDSDDEGDGSEDRVEELEAELTALQQENQELQEQLAEYHDAFDEIEGALDEGREKVPMLKSMFEHLRDLLPES